MQVLGIGVDALGAAHVGSGQRKGVLELLLELFEDAQEVVAGVEVVHGEIKEALDLVGMEVAGHDGIGPCYLKHVGHQLGTDGSTGLVLAVLTGPAIVRDDGNDTVGRCPLGSVYGQEKLHQVVGGGESGLDDKTGGATHALLEIGLEFTVTEAGNLEGAQNNLGIVLLPHTVHSGNYLLREVAGSITSKQRQTVLMDCIDHIELRIVPI